MNMAKTEISLGLAFCGGAIVDDCDANGVLP